MSATDSPKLSPKPVPDFEHELALISQGHRYVAGVDEAGRGPLAGPVVVAAVVLDAENIPRGLNDSKKLSAKRRDNLFVQIVVGAQVAVVSAPPHIIEKFNIRGATLWAMAKAVRSLATLPDYVLIDGRDVPEALPCPGRALIKGDARSLSIAAASIAAKVMRDRMCAIMDLHVPGYGIASNKGYGTAVHMAALNRLGASPHHRIGFAPVTRAKSPDIKR